MSRGLVVQLVMLTQGLTMTGLVIGMDRDSCTVRNVG